SYVPKSPFPCNRPFMTVEEIRKLQPGVVMNGRLHGKGDFGTYERQMKATKPTAGWYEFCNTWTEYWPHVNGAEFRAPGFILGQLVSARAMAVNYLPGVGPMAN